MTRESLVSPFNVKALGEDGTFEGYGSVFGVVDAYGDVVAKGAFARTLREAREKRRMPAMLWQHRPSEPIGIWTEMREDDAGLFVRGQLAQTAQGRDAHTLLKMGALSGLSIGYLTRKREVDDETGITTLTDLDLWEVSPVTFPANDEARVTDVRSVGEMTEREFEHWLVDTGGFSRSHAKALIAHGYRALMREAERATQREAAPPFSNEEYASLFLRLSSVETTEKGLTR